MVLSFEEIIRLQVAKAMTHGRRWLLMQEINRVVVKDGTATHEGLLPNDMLCHVAGPAHERDSPERFIENHLIIAARLFDKGDFSLNVASYENEQILGVLCSPENIGVGNIGPAPRRTPEEFEQAWRANGNCR